MCVAADVYYLSGSKVLSISLTLTRANTNAQSKLKRNRHRKKGVTQTGEPRARAIEIKDKRAEPEKPKSKSPIPEKSGAGLVTRESLGLILHQSDILIAIRPSLFCEGTIRGSLRRIQIDFVRAFGL
jgi:hypothetical protein